MDQIINKVANSGIITIDLEEMLEGGDRVLFDVKPYLFQELILREKDFREFIKIHDWSQYKDKLVAITCTADAVVPTWAYMLLALALEPFAKKVTFGNLETLESELFNEKLTELDLHSFSNARVVVKGCGDKRIPLNAYLKLSLLLKPVVRSLMFGEPCSTVPLYKAKS
jgi:hypothetical protein